MVGSEEFGRGRGQAARERAGGRNPSEKMKPESRKDLKPGMNAKKKEMFGCWWGRVMRGDEKTGSGQSAQRLCSGARRWLKRKRNITNMAVGLRKESGRPALGTGGQARVVMDGLHETREGWR